MWATLLGIPLFVVIFLATDHYLTEWDLIGNKLAIDALGACLGLCAYYSSMGIDVYVNKKRDNPEPFDVPMDVPNAFGAVKQVISEGLYGPFAWSLKTTDTEESRIMATMTFTETFGLGVVVPSTQTKRLVLLQVSFEPIEEAEQKPLVEAAPGLGNRQTKVRLNWYVDSPLGRVSVNKLQDDMTYELKKAMGAIVADPPKPKSPFEPPEWVFVLTLLAIIFCFDEIDKYTDVKAKAAEQRKAQQEQYDKEQADRAEAAQRAAQERAQRDAYNQEMQEKYRQAKENQRRGAEQLLEQQQQQYSSPYSNPLNNTAPSNPFTQQLTPRTDKSNGFTLPWRSRYGGNQP